jgi:hypothetical protein
MKKLLLPTLLLSGFILTAALHPVAGKDVAAVITINISTDLGKSPEGAQVTLANHDGLPEHIYTALSPPNGIVVFPDVFEGTYDFSVLLFGYDPYFENNIVITQDLTIDILLVAITLPPLGIWVDALTLVAYWQKPPVHIVFFSENWDSGNFAANDWTFDPSQGNWSIYSPESLIPVHYAQFGFWPEVYNYSYALVSKSFSRNGPPITRLRFDLSLSNFLTTTNENLAVELWDGLLWKEVTNFSSQDYPAGIPWTTYTFDINDLLQGMVNMGVRFRAWGADSYNINWWGIDNISVFGENEHVTASEYELYLDGSLIATTQDTTYTIPPSLVNWGQTYSAWVKAFYPDGGSVQSPPFIFTSGHLPPPQYLVGEDIGHAVHLTWQPPDESPQSGSLSGHETGDLLGYHIYRDNSLIDSTDADTLEYYDYNLLAGYYSYEVTALYDDPTPGESQPAGPADVYITCDGLITGSVTGGGIQPLTGVVVTLIIGDSSIVISDSTGSFSYVVQEGTYTLCAEADGYETLCIENIYVPCDHTVIIEIMLMESPYPPLSVTATPNEEDTTVIVHWYPYQDFYMIVYDDDIADNVSAWDEEGNMNAVRFTPTAYPAEIYGLAVNMYNGTWPPGDILTPFKAAVYDDDGDYNLPGTELAIVDVNPYDYGWVYADFSNADVSITNGDFYGVMIQGGDFPNCAPIAVDTSSHAGRSYSRDVSQGEPWRPADYHDFMMRAYIYNNTRSPVMSNSGQNDIQTRDFENYIVYVLPQGEEGNPDVWTLKSDNLTQISYTDTDWATYPAGWYRYAVIAEYTYNQSEPAFSNPVEQVIIGINEPDGESINVYPVPAKDVVIIEVNNNIRDLKIINYTGQVVYEQQVGGEKTLRINTSGFRIGSYLIEFISDNGNVMTRKLVIVG